MPADLILLLLAGAVCIGILVWLFWMPRSSQNDSRHDSTR